MDPKALEAAGRSIERPDSIISMTTTTSINDYDDTLSSVTTPRGQSPIQHSSGSSDLPPPSYDESQAAYLDPSPLPRTGTNDTIVFRTTVPQHGFPPPQHLEDAGYGVNDAFTTRDGTETELGDQPRASALLYQALAFTSSPAPPQTDNYVSHLTRPVAIPAITSSLSSTDSVRFARLYARALQSTSITAAQFASFVDGLNAICTASAFTASHLHASTPFRFNASAPNADVPREEWVRAFIQLSNADFFGPRGLRVQITNLPELAELAKIPDRHSFRDSMCRAVLDAASAGQGTAGDESLEVARDAAQSLDPYIEPLTKMIPAMHRDSEMMDHIANGLANFDIAESDRKGGQSSASTAVPSNPIRTQSDFNAQAVPFELERATSDPSTSTTGGALNKFWNPLGLGPLSLGPIIPPRIPPSDRPHPLDRSQSVQTWGEDFGVRMQKWGEEYGKRWNQWGQEYGQAWQEWGNDINTKFAGRSSTSVNNIRGQHNDGGASRESFVSMNSHASASDSSKAIKRKPVNSSSFCTPKNTSSCPISGMRSSSTLAEPEHDPDFPDLDANLDDISVSSSSTSSSDSSWADDPQQSYNLRIAELESARSQAQLHGKKKPAHIERDYAQGLAKATNERRKREERFEKKMKSIEVRRHSRAFKRQLHAWKKAWYKDLKAAKKERKSHADVQKITNKRMKEFHAYKAQWEEKRREIQGLDYSRRGEWLERRRERRMCKG
ncbi:hypothetical protein BT63DRAFT_313236 [Microthyrium microscopicum]|uniref:Uncharacterized protein n=1 Tax=Microthyrium microscopicum TaxID=703497 RepID=A0A6A6U3Z3_9PEZI|nr:hypothetical protein BT63DRAFT_313236 [Microthyrium microscopicum]